MSSISDGFDELALPRRKSPAGWTLPPLRRSGVLRSGLGRSPRGSATGSRAGQKSFRPGCCFFLQRKPRRAQTTANNYASLLFDLNRFEEAKTLLRKTMPVARRVLSESNDTTLRMRWVYAKALYLDPAATLDDIREAVTTLEEIQRTAQRVLGGTHPHLEKIGTCLKNSRITLVNAITLANAKPS